MLTSMFMHGGWGHILGNMLFLWVFGNNIEDSMGHLRFLVFYLLMRRRGGARAGLPHRRRSPVPAVGASGAISGVMGAYVVLYPQVRVHTWFPPIFFFDLPAYFFLGYWFFLQLCSGVATIGPEAGQQGGVAVWAHVGGFVAGVLLIKLFEKRRAHRRQARQGEAEPLGGGAAGVVRVRFSDLSARPRARDGPAARFPHPRRPMIRPTKLLYMLLPLWLTAALLLVSGLVTGRAQQPADTTTAPAAAVAPQSDRSGLAAQAQPGSPVAGGDVTAAQRARLAREEARGGTLAERAVSLLGLVVFVLLAWLISVDRRAVNWRTVGWGLGLQFIFAALILLTRPGRALFDSLNTVFTRLLGYTNEGAAFLFGNLVTSNVPGRPGGRADGAAERADGLGEHRRHLRLQRAADDHLLLQPDDAALLLRRHAAAGEGLRLGDAADDGHVGGGEPERGGEHLHGADGGAAAGEALREDDDQERAARGDDGGLRHGGGRGAGGVRRDADGLLPRHRRAPARRLGDVGAWPRWPSPR